LFTTNFRNESKSKMMQKILKRIYKLFHPVLGEIWCLHRVLNNKSEFVENSFLEISLEFLENKIEHFKAVDFVSIDEVYLRRLSKFRYWWQNKFINITFDDGFEDIYTNAFPIFKKHNIPFTIYLSTDFIEKKALIWWLVLEEIILNHDEVELSSGVVYSSPDLVSKKKVFQIICDLIYHVNDQPADVFRSMLSRYASCFEKKIAATLSWEQIREMCDSGLCTIGSHTVTHPILTKQPEEEARKEIKESKRILETQLQRDVIHFSYPHSFWNQEVQDIVLDSGYKTATMGYGGSCRYKKDDVLKLPRVYMVES